MKKYIFAVLLLAVLIVVSFVKTRRQQDKEVDAYQSGVQKTQSELNTSKQKIDSLTRLASAQELKFADSITSTHQMYQRQLDSVNHVLGIRDSIRGDLEQSDKNTAGGLASRNDRKKSVLHEQILSSYQKKYMALPGDLSEYERKVALSEIRQETANKFSITLVELRRIREEYELNY